MQQSKRIANTLLVVGAIVGASGCRPDRPTEPLTNALVIQGAIVPALPETIRDEERGFAEISRAAPGAAGYYVDEAGNLVLLLRDQSEDGAARAALTQIKTEGRLLTPAARNRRIVVKAAQFSYGQLATWRDRLFDSVFTQLDGVSSLDLDERRNRVTIGLDPQLAADLRPRVLKTAAGLGVDTSAINFRERGNVRYSSSTTTSAAVLGLTIQHAFDTIVGGIQIRSPAAQGMGGNPGFCTVGFVALRNGVRTFVTATHCSSNWGAIDNTVMSQAGVGRRIGAEYIDPNKWSCGFYDYCRESDAAMYSIDDTVDALHGLIARTTYANNGYLNGGVGSLVIDSLRPYFVVTVAGQSLPSGWYVNKMGITTGWTWGTVENTCVDHHNGTWPGRYTTTCAYEADLREDPGDSGGPVFTLEGGDAVGLVGTIIGSNGDYAVFSRYSRIVSEMGGTIQTVRGVNLSTPSNIGGSVSGEHPVVSWNAVSGATHYYVYAQRYLFTGYDEWGNPTYELGGSEYRGVTTAASFTDTEQWVSCAGFCSSPPDEIYYFVRARSKTDVSPWSSSVTFGL